MRNLVFLFFIVLAISTTSCRKDFSTIPNFGQLEFSRDTVYLDTIFTNIGSATYNLKVYNRSNKDITIPSIALENGTNSNYRLNVDGIPGKDFQNIDILAKDSIFIFVETTIDVASLTDPLYLDRILFDTGTNQQDVDLVTLVQNAHFIFPGKNPITMKIDSLSLDGQPTTIKGRFLTDAELNFTDDKPYVIYGYATVPANKTLVVDAGARIHFHDNSGLIVDTDATLNVNGSLNEKVIFEGDRLEHAFDKAPGQWGAIWLREGSKNNSINHTIIKNGIIGLLIDSNTTTSLIQNTEIYNHSNFGILARQAAVSGFNLVIGSAGEASLACIGGGDYTFSYGTFANYWNNGIRSLPTVLVNNFFSTTDQNGQEVIEPKDLTGANFYDCIIDGNNNIEFVADRVDGALFNFKVSRSMVKFNDLNNTFAGVSELDFNDTNLYENIVLNGFPHFRDPTNSNFIIGQDSDAIGIATPLFIQMYDILGVARNFIMPDAGAYEHITF
tara:strand:- start:19819 stop:21318 length:1500 start_codon:yes stop_codon:yes gene_type:complete